jgi:hypothetical protein
LYPQFRRKSRRLLYILTGFGLLGLSLGLLGLRQSYPLSTPRRGTGNLFSASTARLNSLPHTILWAWEIPEDLRFIDVRATGVAFLAETISVNPNPDQLTARTDIAVRPRRQPLRVPARTSLIAVARIEDRAGAKWDLENVSQIAEEIARLTEMPGITGIQVDFDATLSQREFYRRILRDLRQRIPADMPLSITALASWCLGDPWLDSLPVDETVPMLFRLGVDDRNIRGLLADGGDFRSPACGGSLGFSTDEPFFVHSSVMLSGRRIYWFHPHPWTAAVFHDAVKGAGR